jgi:hypothetical protein
MLQLSLLPFSLPVVCLRNVLLDGPRSHIRLETTKEIPMGILEEAAGAFAAVEGVKKLDPNAGILTEGVAAVAGFEGTEAITNFIEKKEEEKPAE